MRNRRTFLTVIASGGVVDVTAPTVTGFAATSPSGLTIAVPTFTASEPGVSYLITETSDQPAAGAAGWAAEAPTTYAVLTSGTKTLYPWVKDAAGNVSPVYGSPASVVVALLYDQFTTPDDAPLTSPRTCEPGPDTLVVTDAANKLSISGGQLVKAAGTWKLLSGSAFNRANGLYFYGRETATVTNGEGFLGATEGGTNLTDGALIRGGAIAIQDDGTTVYQVGFLPQQLGTLHDFLTVKRSVGAFVFVRGGRFGKWHLLYPASNSNGASDKWMRKNSNVTDAGVSDDAQVGTMGGTMATDYGFATLHTASPASGVSGTASRDSLLEFTWTPGAGETLEIYGRQVDAQNRMILRCSQGGSTIALLRVTANVETSMQSVAQTWTIGTPYKIVLHAYSYRWIAYVAGTIKITQSNLINELGTTWGAAGFTVGANFAVYPLNVRLPAPFDFSGFRWYFSYGDSKTVDNNYQAYLCDKLEVSTGSRWCYETIARTGYSVATMVPLITNDLARMTETPEICLLNLGSNDVSALPAEATWKANYRTIIEAIHAKWASAKIYLAKPVRLSGNPPSTPLAAVATMHGYIDGLVGEYDYVYAGIDETALENGTGYATYLSDVTHPNNAGYDQCATLWKTVLGL